MTSSQIQWHHTVDVLVVGSGNGALTAAICCYDFSKKKNAKAKNGEPANVLVIEKSDKFGGTSALSGGGVWVPNNRYAKEAGAQDSFDEAYTYLDNTVPAADVDRNMLKTYLTNAPKMIEYLYQHTHMKFQTLAKYPDYYNNLAGSKTGHRSMEPLPVNYSDLGSDMKNMRPNGALYVNYKFAITQAEAHVLLEDKSQRNKILFKIFLQYYTDIFWLLRFKGISRRTTGGAAGIIRLFVSMKERKIPLWINTAFKELIVEDGKVVGAVIEQEGKCLNVKANEAVLLAAGGFEYNQEMREKYLPKPTNREWSAGCKHNTGDAIQAGLNIGAAVSLMNNAWWCTTKVIPNRPYPFLSIVNKSLPGSIVVNKLGQRFSNESQNYMAFILETFAKFDQGNPCLPCYMIFDQSFRSRRSVWPWALPDKMIPQACFDSGLIAKGNTIEELAANLGIDVTGLSQTVKDFNGYAKTGIDLDFHRGEAAYDRYYGDTAVTPNPCLGPLQQAPFYAVRLQAGDFGTQGGLVINENAQVCDTQGEVIQGLYAFGNTSAAILPTYPGPGSTLGPAMTFGYQAAKHIFEYYDK